MRLSSRATKGRRALHMTDELQLRRASFISPVTGERLKRSFTLREATRWRSEDRAADELAPLLGHTRIGLAVPAGSRRASWMSALQNLCAETWAAVNSHHGHGILKCALAYMIGSLVTLVPALAALVGDWQDSKHMVATVVSDDGLANGTPHRLTV